VAADISWKYSQIAQVFPRLTYFQSVLGRYLVFWQDMSGFEKPQTSCISGAYMQFFQIAYFIRYSKMRCEGNLRIT
jgi:hypothetical protein